MANRQRRFFPTAVSVLMVVAFWMLPLSDWMVLGAAPPVQNGTAYVLVPKDIPLLHGVYRMNDYSTGEKVNPELPLFSLGAPFGGKVSGLAANQQNQIFLLSGPLTGTWASAPVDFLPDPADFSLDSPIYLKLLSPSDYINWTRVHGVRTGSFPTSGHGPFWFKNLPINGTTYTWAMRAGGPNSHVYLNGINATQGIPLYDGQGGHKHPSDSTRVMLPSNWGAVSYWAHGTRNGPAYLVGQPLDGSEDPPNSGNFRPQTAALDVPFSHGLPSEEAGGVWRTAQTSFSCVVKRHYDIRERALDLWRVDDFNPIQGPIAESTGVLTTQDVRVWESYARGCGDNCIPGGAMSGKSIDVALSSVDVVTSTTGNRYGFNRKGQKSGPYLEENKAALRVVKKGSSVNETISPVLADGTLNPAVLTNAAHLEGKGVASSTLRCIGVSSRFDGSTLDFLYGSNADYFVMQDSWWGRGGLGYEYFHETGILQKLDFQANNDPTPVLVTTLSETERANIDDIAVDGEGFLYFLRTEKEPVDTVMAVFSPSANSYDSHQDFRREEGWYRKVVSSEPESPTNIELVPTGQEAPTDFKYVYFAQEVRKRVLRHAPVTGSGFGPATDRGYVRAGEDLWKFKLLRSGPSWELPGQIAAPGERDSTIKAELAVVNLAVAPGVYNADGSQPSIIRVDRGDTDEILNEGESLVFKVEGYKPYLPDDNGVVKRTPLRYVGDVANAAGTPIFANLAINQLPAADGTFNHDEDEDGTASGFPSSMYEDSNWSTQFKWKVEWIDESGQLLKVIEPGKILNGGASVDAADFTATFPHPGNYLVSAEITYRYFDYTQLGPGSRPADLFDKWVSNTISAIPRLVRVKSPSNLNNEIDSYVTNIKLLPENGVPEAFQNVTAVTDGRYDFPEDEQPGNLGFSFEARFVRDANVRTSVDDPLTTYGGIGVWDYDTYIDKFAACGESVELTKTHRHVYNYDNGVPNLSVYNPGWKKDSDTDSPSRATCGTMVEVVNPSLTGISPEDEWFRKDLAFIRWRMFLTPTCSKVATGYTPPAQGVEIASGSLAEGPPWVTMTGEGERKFKFTVTIPPSRIATITTPIDPETYSVRLQIVYPRVAWHETSVDGGKQYRSLIPEDALQTGMEGGIHCVAQVAHGSNNIVTSSADQYGNSYFANRESWELRARDQTLPSFYHASEILKHSTGDPVPIAAVEFSATDNNPVATFSDFQVQYQRVKDSNRRCDTTDFNREEALSMPPVAANPEILPNDQGFFRNEDYHVTATFTTEIEEYGPDGYFAPDGALQNWVGTLTYFAVGNVQDGYGPDGANTIHYFGYPASDVPTLECALQRYDNDPPSLMVELISQADNRRWVVKVIEDVNDAEALTTDPGMLAETTVEVGCYFLDTGVAAISGVASVTVKVPGYTNCPVEVNADARIIDLRSLSLVSGYLPRVRRSSRLMVNIDVEDNVSYQDLTDAVLTIKEPANASPNDNLLPDPAPLIDLTRTHNEDGVVIAPSPRARFVADMPMRVGATQPQVEVTLTATDANGNSRGVVIPVTVVDSTFDARVIESSESRR